MPLPGPIKAVLKRWYYSHWPGQAGSFPYFGTRVYFPRNSHLFLRVCREDIYERELLRFVRGFLRPGACYFDIGANIGLTSVSFLRDFPECKVVSFEPSPHALPFLLKTHAGSPFNSRWSVIGRALGNEIGEAEFHTGGPENSAFDGLQNTRRGGNKSVIRVPISTLDSEWDKLNRPNIAVVKIDVEGAEIKVLQGGARCIRAQRPALVIEWNPQNLSAAKCPPEVLLNWAANERYQIFSLPAAIPVADAHALKLQMIRTDQFLLLSKENTSSIS